MKSIPRFKKLPLLFALGLILFIWPFFNANWIKITPLNFFDPDIPPAFNNNRLVFIADVHRGPFVSQKRVDKLVKLINKLQPNLVLLGGDYTHRGPKYIPLVFSSFSQLHASDGVFAVMGNHDHWDGMQLTQQQALANQVKLIDNQAVWLTKNNQKIKLGGVGDLMEDSQNLEPTISDLQSSDFAILLSHNPDYFDKITTDKIDLALAGHTHAGQVSFFGLWAPILPTTTGQKYRYGLVKLSNFTAYITSGAGHIFPPIRLFTRPEIVVITLKSSNVN
jgi:predicted MPP superfamily phosphohydrolase